MLPGPIQAMPVGVDGFGPARPKVMKHSWDAVLLKWALLSPDLGFHRLAGWLRWMRTIVDKLYSCQVSPIAWTRLEHTAPKCKLIAAGCAGLRGRRNL
jgi:hypothetical protein